MAHSNASAQGRETLFDKLQALPPVEQEFWLNEFLEAVDESAVCWTEADAPDAAVSNNAEALWKKLDGIIGVLVSPQKLATFIRELDEEAEFEAEIEAPLHAGSSRRRVIDYENAEPLFDQLEVLERKEAGTNGSRSQS